uniref:Uncharacterized protein n=1 Tax=Amphora coffeiformis TaxID=265554 RepID=A0A7S3P0A7_9STRA
MSDGRKNERKSMTAVADCHKADLGQLYLSDLDGAESVFSVESRNSQYSADRRKVLKKGDPALSQSCHEDRSSNSASSSDRGFFSYHKDQQHSLRSGGRRRPTRSQSMDHGRPDYGSRDDSEESSDNSDDSSFTNDLHNYSKKAMAETNSIPRRGGRRSKSLDFTNAEIEIVHDLEPDSESKEEEEMEPTAASSKAPASLRRSLPARSKSSDVCQPPATATRNKNQPINKSPMRSKSVEGLRKTFDKSNNSSSGHSEGSTRKVVSGNSNLDNIRSKSIKLLRQELAGLGISTKDAVEKEDLVQLLYKSSGNNNNNKFASSSSSSRNGLSSSPNTVAISLDDLRSKSIKMLRQELDSLHVSTKDAVEKEDLVQRLYNAQSKRRMSSFV